MSKPVYTPREVARLVAMVAEGAAAWQIAEALGRSTRAIRTKLRRLGISLYRARAAIVGKWRAFEIRKIGDRFSVWMQISPAMTRKQAERYLADRPRLAAAARLGEMRCASELLLRPDTRQSVANAELRSATCRANGAIGAAARWGKASPAPAAHPVGAQVFPWRETEALRLALAPRLSGTQEPPPTFSCFMVPKAPQLDVVL